MRGFLSVPVLAVGAVLGYGFAFHAMHHHRHEHRHWERHVADVCVGAARSTRSDAHRDTRETESPEP
jgi:hypothetical protein